MTFNRKITIRRLNEIIAALTAIDLTIADKLQYAVKTHVQPSIEKARQKILKQQDRRVQDINLEHAATDKDGLLIIKDNAYQYTKEDKKKHNEALRKLEDELEDWDCEIKVYFTHSWSEKRKITEETFEALKDVLFTDEDREKMKFAPAEPDADELTVSRETLPVNGQHEPQLT